MRYHIYKCGSKHLYSHTKSLWVNTRYFFKKYIHKSICIYIEPLSVQDRKEIKLTFCGKRTETEVETCIELIKKAKKKKLGIKIDKSFANKRFDRKKYVKKIVPNAYKLNGKQEEIKKMHIYIYIYIYIMESKKEKCVCIHDVNKEKLYIGSVLLAVLRQQ